MSPTPSLFQRFLRGLVLRLVVLLGAFLGNREAVLRARLAVMPENHRHRRGLEHELARLEQAREWLDDPEWMDDPRVPGMLAEWARVVNDAGRRGWMPRRGYPDWFFALPVAGPVPMASLRAPGGRCTTSFGL